MTEKIKYGFYRKNNAEAEIQMHTQGDIASLYKIVNKRIKY